MTRRQILLLVALTLMWGCNWPVMKFSLREVPPLTFRALTMTGGVLLMAAWFALARELPAQASAFSLMAVPMVGVLSSALVIGEAPRPSDWMALLFIAAAIAAATGAGARRSENAGR